MLRTVIEEPTSNFNAATWVDGAEAALDRRDDANDD